MKYPGDMAPYRQVDAWLIAGGWVQLDGTNQGSHQWKLYRGSKVTIATYSEAVKIQKRRDAQARNQP